MNKVNIFNVDDIIRLKKRIGVKRKKPLKNILWGKKYGEIFKYFAYLNGYIIKQGEGFMGVRHYFHL